MGLRKVFAILCVYMGFTMYDLLRQREPDLVQSNGSLWQQGIRVCGTVYLRIVRRWQCGTFYSKTNLQHSRVVSEEDFTIRTRSTKTCYDI